MKRKMIITTSIVAALLFTGCRFGAGVNKDFATGLTSTFKTMTAENIYLADGSGKRLSDNTVTLGSQLNVVASGVENLTEKDGVVFPGCKIVLVDEAKNEILNIDDAFSDFSKGVSPENASTIAATVTAGDPMQAGKTYHLSVRFFDKQNPGSEIVCKVDIVVK